jgi:hypothetical protein
LVVIHPKFGYSKKTGETSPAAAFMRNIVETKGSGQRIHRNTLVFAVGDSERLGSLEESVRQFLSWREVSRNYESLNLNAQQKKQADEWVKRTNEAVTDKIVEAYSWGCYPNQPEPTKPFELEFVKVDASNQSLSERLGAKLERGGILVTAYSPAGLGSELSAHLALAWAQNDLKLEEVWGYFTRHMYLPKIVSRAVLDEAIRGLPGSVLVGRESFAVAESFDSGTNRYIGLTLAGDADRQVQPLDSLLIVPPDKAAAQRKADLANAGESMTPSDTSDSETEGDASHRGTPTPTASTAGLKTRFFGSVSVDSTLYGRDFTNISREILDRLADSDVELEITLEIHAKKATAFGQGAQRTVSENAKTLKFDNAEFEER